MREIFERKSAAGGTLRSHVSARVVGRPGEETLLVSITPPEGAEATAAFSAQEAAHLARSILDSHPRLADDDGLIGSEPSC